MALYVRNQTNDTVWVALGYHAPRCPDSDNWAKKAWWQISPLGTANVRAEDTRGRKYFFYANNFRGVEWSGEFFTMLPPQPVDWCWKISSSDSIRRGMRKLIVPVDRPEWTIVLTRS